MSGRGRLGQIVAQRRRVLYLVEDDQAVRDAAQPVAGDIEHVAAFGLGCDPAGLDRQIRELGVQVPRGGQPDDAIGVLIPIAIGILHGDLGLAQAALVVAARRLGDAGTAPERIGRYSDAALPACAACVCCA